MFDTLAVLAYLIKYDSGMSDHLRLQAYFSEKQKTTATQSVQSPKIKWKGVPPEASSLALIIKDAKLSADTKKQHYYWIVYNLPIQAKKLNYGDDHQINPYNEGINSWGQKCYHTKQTHPVIVELYVLDQRFSAQHAMTGEALEKKIHGHVLVKKTVMG